jgi:hypothetical protein
MEMQTETTFRKRFYLLKNPWQTNILLFWCFSIWLQQLDGEYRYNILNNQLDNGTISVLKAVCIQCDHIYLKVKQNDKCICVLIEQVLVSKVSPNLCRILISEGKVITWFFGYYGIKGIDWPLELRGKSSSFHP